MSSLSSLSYTLRILMLGLLMAGALVKPMLAFDCDIRGAGQVLAGDLRAVAGQEPAQDAHDDCCSLPSCGDCCAHTAAVIPQFQVNMMVSTAKAALPSLSVEFAPTAQSLVFRPPITT
jgi:hypothetical protein